MAHASEAPLRPDAIVTAATGDFEKDVAAAAADLRHNRVKIIRLTSHSIDDLGAATIATALERNESLRELDLDDNAIGDRGAEAIATAFELNQSLHTLSLNGNSIGDWGAAAIAKALERNTSLHTLSIESNNIGDSGATALAAALKHNTTLRTLNLERNNFGDSGAAKVEAALDRRRPEDNEPGAMELDLRDFLAGHVLRQGMLLFEDGMGPWVKREVREHFNRKLGVGHADDERAAAEHDATVKARAEQRAALMRLHDDLNEKLTACAKRDKQAIKQERKEVAEQVKALDPKHDPAPPVPRWVEECRHFFGSKMRFHVLADSRWDVQTIVVVVRALLPDVFARALPDHFHAKELLDGLVRAVQMRNGRAHRAELTESDAVEALRQMGAVLRRCGCDDAKADRIEALLSEAKEIVERARQMGGGGDTTTCAGPILSADDANAQQLYKALRSWELHVETAMGLVAPSKDGTVTASAGERARLKYDDGAVAFGAHLAPGWSKIVKKLKPHFQVVTRARHWYFHNLVEDKCDVAAALAAMADAASAIAAAPIAVAGVAPWRPPCVVGKATPTVLLLSTPCMRASVRVARVGHMFIGRHDVVNEIATSLGRGARVVVHGPPGVGKDAVMAEVAHRSEVRSMGGMQAWLQASSDVVLRRQLIELFATHRPAVVKGLVDDAEAAVGAIRRWLSTHTDWVLFVEDASPSSVTLWEVLPPAGEGGCAIVTSQSTLELAQFPLTARFKVEPITTDESIELLRRSNVFARRVPRPPKGETEEELRMRCATAGPTCDAYTPPTPWETDKMRRQRRKEIEAKLFEHTELSRPELRDFLESALGNLPLSVALCAQLLRADERVGGVLDLIALFKRTGDLAEVDRAGRNPMFDTHYFGLYLSVKIALDRLRGAEGVPLADREHAMDVLAVLSLLDRAQTPVELLTGHDPAELLQEATARSACYAASCRACSTPEPCYSPACNDWRQRRERLVRLFVDAEALSRARDLCIGHGLLQEGADNAPADGVVVVGGMHQLVQRCVLHELVVLPADGSAVASVARDALLRRFDFSDGTSPSEWPRLRRLMPCVEAWAGHVMGDRNELYGETGSVVKWTDADGVIIGRWGLMLLRADGDAKTAESVLSALLTQQRRALPADHPDIATSMNNLAATYSDLGYYEDALGLQEEVLAFRRRVLPPDHPDIATSLGNLALSYSDVGAHEDALRLQEEVLAVLQRVLPADHPHIATSMGNLASTYYALRRKGEAHKLQERVLAIRRRVLPPDHPDIATSMNNLAVTLSVLGRHEEARELKEEALAFRQRVLPVDHPDIAKSMANLASTLSDLGLHEDALKLQREVLEIRRRVLPPDDPAIATSISNLAFSCSQLGRREEALRLHEEALAVGQRAGSRDFSLLSTLMGNLAIALWQLGDAVAAERHMRGAMEVLVRAGLQAEHPQLRQFKEALSTLRLQASLDGAQPVASGGEPRSSSAAPSTASPAAEPEPPSEVEVDAAVKPESHTCPICLDKPDDSGDFGLCYACGALFCGDCNTPDKIGRLSCPMCRYPLPEVSDAAKVELLTSMLDTRSEGRHTAPAMHLLGHAYANGQGVPRDRDTAVALFKSAADRGSAGSKVTLGLCYERGVGVAQSDEKAVQLYRAAAAEGHPKAQWILGNRFMIGHGVGRADAAEAVRLYRLSAEQGFADAQCRLGDCFARGAGVPADVVAAAQWYRRAADQGLAAAQLRLGDCCRSGVGVERDVDAAANLYQRAADQGNTQAKANLSVLRGQQLQDSGDLDGALGHFKTGLKRQRQIHDDGADHSDTATLLHAIGGVLVSKGDFHGALEHFNASLAIQRRLCGGVADRPEMATTMSDLASTYSAVGRHEDALRLQEEALALRRRVLTPDHPDIATSMSNLASALSALGRHEEALKLREEALTLLRRVLPGDHPAIVTLTSELASAHVALGRLEHARDLQREVLVMARRVLPSDHTDIAAYLGDLAATNSALGQHEDALKLRKKILALRRRELQADHPDIATSMSNLASAYGAVGRHKDALKLQEEVLAFQRRVLSADHPDIAASMSHLASAYGAVGRHKDALKLQKSALAFRRRVLPSDHSDIASSMNDLADTYRALGRHDDALRLQEEAVALRRQALPADRQDAATPTTRVSAAHSVSGDRRSGVAVAPP